MKNEQEIAQIKEQLFCNVGLADHMRFGKDRTEMGEYVDERLARDRIDEEMLGVGVQNEVDELLVQGMGEEEARVKELRRSVFL